MSKKLVEFVGRASNIFSQCYNDLKILISEVEEAEKVANNKVDKIALTTLKAKLKTIFGVMRFIWWGD